MAKKTTKKPVPTTGNEKVDKIVRESFTQAIEVLRQVVMDLAPDTDPAVADKIAAVGAVQVWPYLANIIALGVPIAIQEEPS